MAGALAVIRHARVHGTKHRPWLARCWRGARRRSPPKQVVSVMGLLPESRRFLEAQYISNYVVGIGIGDYQVRHFHVI
jgi:hypothetical protein